MKPCHAIPDHEQNRRKGIIRQVFSYSQYTTKSRYTLAILMGGLTD